MLYSRWLSLGLFVGLLAFIYVRKDDGNLKDKIKHYGMMFIEGMIGGIIIDSVGINAGYYFFPRQPLYSLEYFAIVIPCWGVFGLLVNCLWQWAGKEKFIRSMAVTLMPLFAFYEGTNLMAGSWVYTTPFYAVVLGWIPLIWVFSGCNRRRKVIHKMEYLMTQYNGCGFREAFVFNTLRITRYLLIVVMFPLLFTRVCKLIVTFGHLRKRGWGAREYIDYLMTA